MALYNISNGSSYYSILKEMSISENEEHVVLAMFRFFKLI